MTIRKYVYSQSRGNIINIVSSNVQLPFQIKDKTYLEQAMTESGQENALGREGQDLM